MKSEHNDILHNLSFEIKPQTTVAIVGTSGSGKTSIINLLLYFKEKASGQILIGNNPIEQISIKSLRQNISLVSQEVMLFDGSILDNIQYGSPDATMQEVIEAAIQSRASEFIEALPDRYNTLITSKANSISGGQKQRIAIARALLKKASILLLDEAASGLDVNAEIGIYQTLKQFHHEKTTIIITHRLNTIIECDNIIVLHQGTIVEQGKHEELLDNKSHYYSLYNSYLKENK
jgi:ABC-type multidrug transport system fused ATPase/permease subunit